MYHPARRKLINNIVLTIAIITISINQSVRANANIDDNDAKQNENDISFDNNIADFDSIYNDKLNKNWNSDASTLKDFNRPSKPNVDRRTIHIERENADKLKYHETNFDYDENSTLNVTPLRTISEINEEFHVDSTTEYDLTVIPLITTEKSININDRISVTINFNRNDSNTTTDLPQFDNKETETDKKDIVTTTEDSLTEIIETSTGIATTLTITNSTETAINPYNDTTEITSTSTVKTDINNKEALNFENENKTRTSKSITKIYTEKPSRSTNTTDIEEKITEGYVETKINAEDSIMNFFKDTDDLMSVKIKNDNIPKNNIKTIVNQSNVKTDSEIFSNVTAETSFNIENITKSNDAKLKNIIENNTITTQSTIEANISTTTSNSTTKIDVNSNATSRKETQNSKKSTELKEKENKQTELKENIKANKSVIVPSDDNDEIPIFTELDLEDGVDVPEDYYDSSDTVPTAPPNTDALSIIFGLAGSVVETVAEKVVPKSIFDLFKRMQKHNEQLEAERLRSRVENGGIGQFTRDILKSISSGLTKPLNQLMAGAKDIGSLDTDRGFVSSVASGVSSVANVANSLSDAFKTRVQAIYPGTVWCGDGHSAQARTSDLGLFFFTDTCCRQHDACKIFIPAGETKFGLTNTGLFTRSHCSCDTKFRECLRKTNSLVSSQIGLTYFNVLGPQCFRKAHPIVKCTRKTRLTGQKCVEYELDFTKPKMWQWFDNETF